MLKLIPPGERKGNPFWLIRGNHKGKRIERSTGTLSKRDAQGQLNRLIAELEADEAIAEKTTFAEAALSYLKDGGDSRFMAPVLEHFGSRTIIDEITPAMMNEVAHILKPDVQPQTRKRCVITPIRAVLEHHRRGGMRKPQKDNARIRWLTPEEAESLILAARARSERHYRLVMTLLGGGFRTSELVDLRVEHIYPASGEVWIADPKNNTPRYVYMEPARALPALMEGMPSDGAAFRTQHGKPYMSLKAAHSGGQFKRIFDAARIDAGLENDVTPHVLRHTWATWFHACTNTLPHLMGYGGWKSAQMAMRYTKLAPADLPERLEAHGWCFGTGGKMGEMVKGVHLRAL